MHVLYKYNKIYSLFLFIILLLGQEQITTTNANDFLCLHVCHIQFCTEPVAVNIILPNGNTFVAGNDVSIQCDVRGSPRPYVT